MLGDEPLEYTLLNKRECLIYQIPPATAQGHKASDWTTCIWKGRMLITAKGNDLRIKFIHSVGNNVGNIFVEAVVVNGEIDKYVERTPDSSRYFAIRVQDPKSGRKAFLGLGFEDRNDAFDFNCTITDFKNRNDEVVEAEAAPTKDYSLKEGEKIVLNFKGIKSKHKKEDGESKQKKEKDGGAFTGFLPPPPGAARNQPAPVQSGSPPSNPADVFSDFQGFPTAPGDSNPITSETVATAFPTASFSSLLSATPVQDPTSGASDSTPIRGKVVSTATYTGAPVTGTVLNDPFLGDFSGLTIGPPPTAPIRNSNMPSTNAQSTDANLKIDDAFDIFN